jgi:uncharacterized protein
MKKIIFVIPFVLFATLLFGQNTFKTLLWEIKSPESKNVSFLFGTFHEVSPSFFDSLTNVVSKLQQSDILFVEEGVSVSKKQSITNSPLWTVEKWSKLLTNEQKQIFIEFVKKAEDTFYYNLNPLLLSLSTSRLYLTNFCQLDEPFSEPMDHHIEKIALKQNKKVYSLDINQETFLKNTAEKFNLLQDSLYASFSIHLMQNMLKDNFSDCEILNTYKKFDIDYDLDLDLTQNPSKYPLLIERNTKWTMALHESLTTNNCFIAVGFRHLCYKQGLIQQLRNLGYTVTPVQIER